MLLLRIVVAVFVAMVFVLIGSFLAWQTALHYSQWVALGIVTVFALAGAFFMHNILEL